ncbi:hypothetical protein PG984_014943 [Apiospora sp. TS-2023a]
MIAGCSQGRRAAAKGAARPWGAQTPTQTKPTRLPTSSLTLSPFTAFNQRLVEAGATAGDHNIAGHAPDIQNTAPPPAPGAAAAAAISMASTWTEDFPGLAPPPSPLPSPPTPLSAAPSSTSNSATITNDTNCNSTNTNIKAD